MLDVIAFLVSVLDVLSGWLQWRWSAGRCAPLVVVNVTINVGCRVGR
jgi:hypothetical protein